jgi:hypothetical protein
VAHPAAVRPVTLTGKWKGDYFELPESIPSMGKVCSDQHKSDEAVT